MLALLSYVIKSVLITISVLHSKVKTLGFSGFYGSDYYQIEIESNRDLVLTVTGVPTKDGD